MRNCWWQWNNVMPGSVEALVVELHNIVKCGCNTIMKIGCTSGQSPQESALLTSPMSAHLPVITARPGSVTRFEVPSAH